LRSPHAKQPGEGEAEPYRQPERATFERWGRAVPDDFAYAVKLNRFLTHMKRLDVDRAMIARSYDTIGGLGEKAAVVLVQLPARYDSTRNAQPAPSAP